MEQGTREVCGNRRSGHGFFTWPRRGTIIEATLLTISDTGKVIIQNGIFSLPVREKFSTVNKSRSLGHGKKPEC